MCLGELCLTFCTITPGKSTRAHLRRVLLLLYECAGETFMPSITIVTWNVRRPYQPDHPCFVAVARKLREIGADIYILTETHKDLVPGEGYQVFSAPPLPAHPYRHAGERTTMLWVRSDWPVVEIPTFTDLPATDVPPRTALSYAVTSADTSPAACAHVETPVGPLLVYGTVITWSNDEGPHGDDPAQKAGYAQLQYDAIIAHGKDWKRIMRDNPGLPICVAGDLNTTLDGRRYPTIACSDSLQQALAEAGMRHVTQSLDYAIDHICLSEAWAQHASDPCWWQTTYVDAHDGTRKPVSDHRGVQISVTLPVRPGA